MTKIQSFPFSADSRSEILILGSMPGVESLRKQEYYAHPRNLFWDFMGELFGAERERPYEERLQILRDNSIALWDVAHRCRRPGSLDSNISDVEPNDFAALFRTAPHIHTVCFNGKKAAQLFQNKVASQCQRKIRKLPLPSTSPANASIPTAEKTAAWRQLKALVKKDALI